MPFGTIPTELENIMLNEISHGKRQIPYDFTHLWNRKNKIKIEMNKSNQTKTNTWGIEQGLSEENNWGGVQWVKGVNCLVMDGNLTSADDHAVVYTEVKI